MFLYNPENNKCYWLDLTKYIHEHDKENYIIDFCLEQEICDDNYKDFSSYAKTTKNTELSNLKLSLAITQLLLIKDEEDYSIEFIYMLHNHREKILMWNAVLSYFLITNNQCLIYDLLSLMRFQTHNPDIFWHKGNIINNEDVQIFFVSYLNSELRDKFVFKMVEFSSKNDEPFDRGTIHQVIFHLLELINERDKILIKIILDKNVDYMVRSYAFHYLMFFKDEKIINDNLFLLEILKDDDVLDKEEYERYKYHFQNYGCLMF